MILAIDPGPLKSAFVLYDEETKRVKKFVKTANSNVDADQGADFLAVEMIASYGMPVGAEVFETCVWIGRFIEQWPRWKLPPRYIYRRDVKLHVCQDSRAKDSHIRQALIDRWGGKELAIGNTKQRGPLYGVKGDMWAALAVAVTAAET